MSLFRMDRMAALYLVRPVRRVCAPPNRMRIPILMYHSISEEFVANQRPYFALETSPRVFEAHLKYLRDNGYTTISPADVVGVLSSESVDGKKYVAITFDDGYHDFYTTAFPLITKYGFNSTVYLPTLHIDDRSRLLMKRDCLSWAEVRELHKSGVVFGSHTISHSKLEEMSDCDLEQEVRGSKEAIEDKLGSPVRSFSYPFIFPEQDRLFSHRLRDLLKATGYHDGVSKVVGTVQSLEDRFFLRRVPVSSGDDIAMLKAKLEGNYDWFHAARSVLETARRMRSSGFLSRSRSNDLPTYSQDLSTDIPSDLPRDPHYRPTGAPRDSR